MATLMAAKLPDEASLRLIEAPDPPSPDDDIMEEIPEADDEEAEADEESEARRSAGLVRAAKATAQRAKAGRQASRDEAETDGYITGIVVGIEAALSSPIAAGNLSTALIEAIAAGYRVTPSSIREGVEDDAQAMIADYLRCQSA